MNETMISVRGLTKTYGRHRAVDRLGFDVLRERVTGFLGPNGAGKTTTMRILLGLARADAGTATILGSPYGRLVRPAHIVGALLDTGTFHPKRTAWNHLRWVAAAAEIPAARIPAVLDLVELRQAAHRPVGEFSLGMRQRLGLAAALLGDPRLLVLDEPANGLDPAGIRWLRGFLQDFARRGGGVFVSSHLLGEIAQLADDVVVINRGRLVTHTTVGTLTAGSVAATRARTPTPEALAAAVERVGAEARMLEDGALDIRGAAPARVGELAAETGVVLHELVSASQSLEEVFFHLTREETNHAGVA